MIIGFSTGSLALGDFRRGLRMVAGMPTSAIELSALRDHELAELVDTLDELDLREFSYISVHAPSRFVDLSEADIVALLRPVFERHWPVVLHPDAIIDFSIWQQFGNLVCIENMDKRKPIGRTAKELAEVFAKLPDASLCFDIAHARQVDPSMYESRRILRTHGHRLRQVHLSDINANSVHEPLGFTAIQSYRQLASMIPVGIPIILESPIDEDSLLMEIEQAARALKA